MLLQKLILDKIWAVDSAVSRRQSMTLEPESQKKTTWVIGLRRRINLQAERRHRQSNQSHAKNRFRKPIHIHSQHQQSRQKCHTFKPSVFPFKFCLIYMWPNSVSRRCKTLLSDTDRSVANGNTDLEVCCKTCTLRHSFRSLSLSFVLFFLGSLS